MPNKKSFEQNLIELESIVNSLESGETPFDECISLYEKGVKLSDECIKMLNDAKQKITLVTETGEQIFKSDGDNADE